MDVTGSVTASGSTNVLYPLYDCHGNMVSTLAKVGSGSYSYSSVRLFDAWGNVRSANTSGDPKGRYCANLGHKQDDESGLVYMRARYYEPGSGRFVSEDPNKRGSNWFKYGSNTPTLLGDRSGKEDIVSVEAGMSLSEFMSGLGSEVNAIVLNGINGAARVGQAINAGTKLASLMLALEQNPEDWNYVESMAINQSGTQGFLKAFVQMDADQVIMKWLLSSEDGLDNVIPHATPYFDPGGAPPGVGTPINPFGN